MRTNDGQAHLPPSAPASDAAVSDVVGSVIMVGITVLTAVAFGGLLFSFKGPTAQLHSQLAVFVDPGSGGWNTGDETVRILHQGGDAVELADTAIVLTQAGTRTVLQGSDLGSAFADGRLVIGETWARTLRIQSGESVQVQVVASHADGQSMMVSDQAIVASASGSTTLCGTDTSAPAVVAWTQNPAVLAGTTTGPVAVTAQLIDDCWGVNPATTPDLFWRVNDGTNPPYTDQGAMSSIGLNTWRLSVPAQTWSSLIGQRLEYYLSPVTDLGGNTGPTLTRTATILADCTSDVAGPTVQSISQSPPDVRSTTVGNVTIAVTAVDDCSGVNEAIPPVLSYRLNDGTSPAFQPAPAMTRTGTNAWQGAIPAQVWATHIGKTLEYAITGMRDLAGNSANSATYQDPVDAVLTYRYVASNTPTTGTVTTFSNAQSASDAGAEAAVLEGASTGAPASTAYNANGVVTGNGWAGGTNAFASDNTYATYAVDAPATANDLVLNLQDPSGTGGTITRVAIQAEVSITSQNNDGFQIQACIAGQCTVLSPTGGASATDTTLSYDVTLLRPGGGTWSWSDLAGLQVQVHLIQSGQRDGTWRVDRVWADVTAATNTYSTSVRMDWSGVPSSSLQVLELRHRTTGDSFQVQVWDGTAFNTRATLSAATATTWTYTLLPLEFNGGAPRIRFIDATPTGTTQGVLYIDYARVGTA